MLINHLVHQLVHQPFGRTVAHLSLFLTFFTKNFIFSSVIRTITLLNKEHVLINIFTNKCYYHSMHFFFLSIGQEPPRDLQITTNKYGLLMRSTVSTCFTANNILLMHWNHVLEKKIADRFPELPGSD